MDKTMPRVCYFDIETSPHLGHFWDLYETNPVNIVKESHLLSFAYQFEGEKIHVFALPDFPLYKKDKHNDRELAKKLWKVMSEAEVIVAHNGDSFDVKKSNARFIKHGFTPPDPYKTVDTLKIARAVAAFPSNKLDSLAKDLGIGRKLPHTGIALWLGCMEGDMKSWKVMKKYNAHDVELLRKVHLRLRPWAKSHPLMTQNNAQCPRCRGVRVERRGYQLKLRSKYQKLHCLNADCGHYFIGDKIK